MGKTANSRKKSGFHAKLPEFTPNFRISRRNRGNGAKGAEQAESDRITGSGCPRERGFCVVCAWFLRGFGVVSAWFLRGGFLCGFCVALRGLCVVSAWFPRGFGVVSAWFLRGVASAWLCVVCAWFPRGFCVVSSPWLPCGFCVVWGFAVSRRAAASVPAWFPRVRAAEVRSDGRGFHVVSAWCPRAWCARGNGLLRMHTIAGSFRPSIIACSWVAMSTFHAAPHAAAPLEHA
jgi:hypothetical protein